MDEELIQDFKELFEFDKEKQKNILKKLFPLEKFQEMDCLQKSVNHFLNQLICFFFRCHCSNSFLK